MIRSQVFLGALFLSFGAVMIQPGTAHAGEGFKWENGEWRLELATYLGFPSGRRDRSGDIGITGTVEREIPLGSRLSIGPKIHPLFFYDENDEGNNTIFGLGFGIQFRFYFKKEERRGWFVEIGEALIAQSDKFAGNSGTINLMGEGGIGYKLSNSWHVSAKIRHLSNAGLAGGNSGVNGVGIGFGYTF